VKPATEPWTFGFDDPETMHDVLRQRARLLAPIEVANMVHENGDGDTVEPRQEGDGTSA